MSMIDVFRSLGRADALKLREEAHALTGTQLIEREVCIPMFNPERDYSQWAVGSPVQDMGQVWILIQPHNAVHYDGRPITLRSLWGLAHTTDPSRAKEWVDPYGTSGMYMKGECYKAASGMVYRAKDDNLVHDADAHPDGWALVANE